MLRSTLGKVTLAILAIALVGTPIMTTTAQASDPFIGEIKIVGFNFAPRGYATCDGQILSIAQYSALFSLLGTTFGGDGRTTFALPDLRGRQATHVGQGNGLSQIRWGERSGAETHTLSTAQMPSHTHTATATLKGTDAAGNIEDPNGATLAQENREDQYRTGATPNVSMTAGSVEVAVGNTGGNQFFGIRDPYLGVYHVIATTGVFPSRN